PQNAHPAVLSVAYTSEGRFTHGTKSTANARLSPIFCRCFAVKTKKATAPQWPQEKESLVGSDGRLDFGFVDVEVRVDMLHVVVFFERLDQAHHLRGLRASQLDVVLRDHPDFRGRGRD